MTAMLRDAAVERDASRVRRRDRARAPWATGAGDQPSLGEFELK